MNASGGIERVVSNLADAWAEKYELYLLTKEDGVSFYSIPSSVHTYSLSVPVILNMNNRFQRMRELISNFFKSRSQLRTIINQIKSDYIYTTTPLNALEIFTLGQQLRKKMVVSEHGSFYGYNRVYTLIKRWIYPKVYCISVPNSRDTEIYKNWGCNALYVPHIVTYKAFTKNSLNSKVAINVGRLTADKQQAELIQMWKNIKVRNSWQLWIVGDGEEYNHLDTLIETLGLRDSVKLLSARKNIEEIYKKASLFVFSSRYEGFGMVLLEAMAFGVPCISFDCPSGPRDVIKDGQNGYLIENGNCQKYIETLETILSMPEEKLEDLGDQAFDTVLSWDNKKILKQWDEVFN